MYSNESLIQFYYREILIIFINQIANCMTKDLELILHPDSIIKDIYVYRELNLDDCCR